MAYSNMEVPCSVPHLVVYKLDKFHIKAFSFQWNERQRLIKTMYIISVLDLTADLVIPRTKILTHPYISHSRNRHIITYRSWSNP